MQIPEAINKLSIDLETYSSVPIKYGVYRYAESPDAEILLFGYSINDGPVIIVDVASGEKIPDHILKALADDSVTKWAFNASFERIFLSCWLKRNYPKYFESYSIPEDSVGNYLDPSSWKCSMVWSAYMGLPLSLEGVGTVLGLEQQKLKEGKDLIRYFCIPCKPTKVNGGRTRNMPSDAPDKWELFKKYNKRDVEVEMSIQQKLSRFPVPDSVWEEYHLDQEINDRGILLDMGVVNHAIQFDAFSKARLIGTLKDKTELENPNSVTQMKDWLVLKGVDTDSLDKKAVLELLKTVPSDVADVLKLRQQLAKSSVKKYQAMQNSVCADGRARGMFQFYGANRSGRWAGRIIQLQNLPQNHMTDLEDARDIVKSGDYELMNMLYDDVPDALSQLIRTAFIPKPEYKFCVSDFSAIEARVLSFLAQENWRIKMFEEGGDIYCQSASKMFGVPVKKHGTNGHLRQKGKIAELACIAEGELVLTDAGLIPIEKVTTEMKLWDGKNWVSHDGVIYKGIKEVIIYEGLTATPDHLVWVEGKREPIQFGIAATRGERLVQAGIGRTPIWLGENNFIRNEKGCLKEASICSEFGETKKLKADIRKARLYDIRNAGEHHRFTVSNCLVHNCGYGGSVGALTAMGALDMGLSEDELQPLVDSWRASNPNIVQFWWDVDRCVKIAIKQRTATETHGIRFVYQSGMLFIVLPSGRRLCYVKPKIGENKFGGESVTYEGVGTNKKWERIESYGPKFVENIVQAISRDILCYAMRTLSHCFIVGHVHDELIIETPMDADLNAICEQMGRTPDWIDGLVLRADGYETAFYKKS